MVKHIHPSSKTTSQKVSLEEVFDRLKKKLAPPNEKDTYWAPVNLHDLMSHRQQYNEKNTKTQTVNQLTLSQALPNFDELDAEAELLDKPMWARLEKNETASPKNVAAKPAKEYQKQQAFNEAEQHKKIEEAYQTALSEGRAEGFNQGYAEGERKGYEQGYELAQKEGLLQGRKEGKKVGHEQGFAEGEKAGFAKGHRQGYQAGEFEAKQEGFDKGYEAGWEKGYDDSYVAGSDIAKKETEHFNGIVQQLLRAWEHFGDDMSHSVTTLAVKVAQHMVAQQLAMKPETIVGIVKAALKQSIQGQAAIYVNPEDLLLLERLMKKEIATMGHVLHADDNLVRGSVVIRSQGIEVMGDIKQRWQEMEALLTQEFSVVPPLAESLPDGQAEEMLVPNYTETRRKQHQQSRGEYVATLTPSSGDAPMGDQQENTAQPIDKDAEDELP